MSQAALDEKLSHYGLMVHVFIHWVKDLTELPRKQDVNKILDRLDGLPVEELPDLEPPTALERFFAIAAEISAMAGYPNPTLLSVLLVTAGIVGLIYILIRSH